jgi:hypothetical protein
VYGRNEEANIRWFEGAKGAEAVIARHRENIGGEARARIHAALHLDSWETWGTGAAERVAAQLGADPAQPRTAMRAEVRSHVNRLLQDLAIDLCWGPPGLAAARPGQGYPRPEARDATARPPATRGGPHVLIATPAGDAKLADIYCRSLASTFACLGCKGVGVGWY